MIAACSFDLNHVTEKESVIINSAYRYYHYIGFDNENVYNLSIVDVLLFVMLCYHTFFNNNHRLFF